MVRCIFDSFGKPAEAVELREAIPRALEHGEIRVRMLAAPVNPADINFIQGTYGVRPELPCTPGIEGCGKVLESRDDAFSRGDTVIFVARVGTWSEEVVCPGSSALKIPDETPVEQAAMLKVNPLTAWAMLTQFVRLPEGSWIIQNAANSGVGTCVIRIAKLLGLRTINLVRRPELVTGLSEIGGDLVLLDNADSVGHIKSAGGHGAPSLALNAVGGDSALRLMDALATGGTHITYGAMSMRSLKVPNKFLIFKGLRLHGFWCTEWMRQKSREETTAIYHRLAEWMIEGKLAQAIDSRYRLTEISAALTRAQESGRDGKVLLTMDTDSG